MTKPVLVYDSDCGFCTQTALSWQRRLARGPLDADVIGSYELDPALGLDARAEQEVLWIAPDGEVFGGPDAVSRWLTWQANPWRPIGLMLRWPGVRQLARVVYRQVAAHRHQLPGATAACRL